MEHRVCPWWLGYFLLGPVRRIWQDPGKILQPYVTRGMTVLEPGPGMGFFTLELARRVGSDGRVIAVDVQPRMLSVLRRRAERAGLGKQIETRLATDGGLAVSDLDGQVEFVLAFAIVHELRDQRAFFDEVFQVLAPEGRLLVAEPRGHVSEDDFRHTLNEAADAGLHTLERPVIAGSRTALLSAPIRTAARPQR